MEDMEAVGGKWTYLSHARLTGAVAEGVEAIREG